MEANDRAVRSPAVVLHEEFDDWAVLFHGETGEAIGASPEGVAIWRLLDGRSTVAEIAAEVAARCEEAPPTLAEDTLAFVTDLEKRLFCRKVAHDG